MIDLKIIRELLKRYSAGTATQEEEQLVERWLLDNEMEGSAWEQMSSANREEWMKSLEVDLLRYVGAGEAGETEKAMLRLPWYRRFYFHMAAASVVVLIAVGSWYFIADEKKPSAFAKKENKIASGDIAPGSNKAVLTLADGGKVVLDDAANGVLANEGTTEVRKQGAGLVYDQKQGKHTIKAIAFNTLTTPRGGQYNVILPDGSHVWLNAASSIKYPVAFPADNRVVEVKGEVYFEVAAQTNAGRKVPFQVKVMTENGDQKSLIEVIGTHFNINAYDEEASVNTTLLEGKVKVFAGDQFAILAPGQQASVSNSRGTIKVLEDIDVDGAVAWKNGLFMMSKADIPVVLRQLARWYDVDIMYSKGMPAGKITGDIPRSMQLSEVLKVMELSGVKCKIAGRKIIVEP